MPLTLKTSKTIEHEINVPVPCFWKRSDGVEWTAVLDEKTAINFYYRDDLATISHSDAEFMRDDIIKAQLEYDLCTESEWLDKYAEVLKSISLAPVMTVGRLYDADAIQALNNSIH